MTEGRNLDPAETAHFDRLAARWWDPEGASRPLHDLNSARVDWIAERAELQGRDVLDIGCGGGLLSEALARRGGKVTGIDAADRPLAVARLHQVESGLNIDYTNATAEELLPEFADRFDVVCCLEMLEHVPDPESVVVASARLTKPGGSVFFSTINRSILAFAGAIVGAEYLLGLLPRGTHRYDRLIRPGELAQAARGAGLTVVEIVGIVYNPWSRTVSVGGPPRINYLMQASKPG